MSVDIQNFDSVDSTTAVHGQALLPKFKPRKQTNIEEQTQMLSKGLCVSGCLFHSKCRCS